VSEPVSTIDTAEHGAQDGHDDHEHKHPTDGTYMGIALLLGVITAAEVATYYVDLGSLLGPILIVMMIAKFSIVAGWFMHLRFDSNLFTRVFVSGIVLAVGVYIAALTSFHYFSS
jgi:cytochrome c oxidase subunit 4